MQSDFKTFCFSLPAIREEEVLSAIAVGLMTIVANQFSHDDEMRSVFNIDLARYSMGELLADNFMDEPDFQSAYMQALEGFETLVQNQLETIEGFMAASEGVSDIVHYVSPGMILLYVREGLSNNINGVYANVENQNASYIEYCQIVGDKPTVKFNVGEYFKEVI